MDDLEYISACRKEFSRLGFAFLIYSVGFTVLSFLLQLIPGVTEGTSYAVVSVLTLIFLFIRKSPGYFLDSCRVQRKMKPGRLAMLVNFVTGGQALFQMLAFLADLIARIFGANIAGVIEHTAVSPVDPAMLIYVCVLAPILEECIFRGWLSRSFQPYGRTFSIFASALFFGLIHGNIVQSPFAFVMGLVFGYVSVEFSMLWALALHIFNNLALGVLLPGALTLLPGSVADMVSFLLYWLCAAISAIYLYSKGDALSRYLKENQPGRRVYFAFFSATGVALAIAVLTALTIFVLF